MNVSGLLSLLSSATWHSSAILSGRRDVGREEGGQSQEVGGADEEVREEVKYREGDE